MTDINQEVLQTKIKLLQKERDFLTQFYFDIRSMLDEVNLQINKLKLHENPIRSVKKESN